MKIPDSRKGDLIKSPLSAFYGLKIKIMLKRVAPYILIALLSCNSEIEKSLPDAPISLESKITSIELDQLFSKWETFELNENEFVSAIVSIRKNNDDEYFFLEGSRKRVFSLSENGEHSLLYNQEGEGLGQVKEIWDFDIDQDSGDFFLLDRKQVKVLHFSPSFELIEEIKLNKEFATSILSMRLLNNNELLFYTSGTSGYKFIKLDLKSQNFESFVPVSPDLKKLGFGLDKAISNSGNQLTTINFLTGQIDFYSKNVEIIDSLEFTLNSTEISTSDLQKIRGDQSLFLELVQNNEKPKAHSFGIFETDDFFIIHYYLGSFMNGKYVKTLLDKNNWKSRTFEKVLLNGVEISFDFIGVIDNSVFWNINKEETKLLSKEEKIKIFEKYAINLGGDQPVILKGNLKALGD